MKYSSERWWDSTYNDMYYLSSLSGLGGRSDNYYASMLYYELRTVVSWFFIRSTRGGSINPYIYITLSLILIIQEYSTHYSAIASFIVISTHSYYIQYYNITLTIIIWEFSFQLLGWYHHVFKNDGVRVCTIGCEWHIFLRSIYCVHLSDHKG